MPRIAKRLDIQAPSYDKLRNKTEHEVRESLGAVERLDDLVKLAAEIVQHADVEIATHVDRRNQALASLYLYDLYEGSHLSQIAGVNKNGLRTILGTVVYGASARKTLPAWMADDDMVALAKEIKVRRITKEPGQQLLRASLVIEEAKARRKAALPVLRNTALKLVEEYGWKIKQVAAHTGLGGKLLSQQLKTARKERHS
ncbi:hypothetical protein [Streptomyces sp. NPDC004286]|uniref:hypothetical protein n=1 Tax=Streptomyces sp. NPDC004286 TaxID=3364696 RepID=UPI0036A09DBB